MWPLNEICLPAYLPECCGNRQSKDLRGKLSNSLEYAPFWKSYKVEIKQEQQ